MLKMDVVEATKTILRNQPTDVAKRLPIVAMKAHNEDQIQKICQSDGINGYLRKPMDPERLFQKNESYCEVGAYPVGNNPLLLLTFCRSEFMSN